MSIERNIERIAEALEGLLTHKIADVLRASDAVVMTQSKTAAAAELAEVAAKGNADEAAAKKKAAAEKRAATKKAKEEAAAKAAADAEKSAASEPEPVASDSGATPAEEPAAEPEVKEPTKAELAAAQAFKKSLLAIGRGNDDYINRIKKVLAGEKAELIPADRRDEVTEAVRAEFPVETDDDI